jgi:hypothetical protein
MGVQMNTADPLGHFEEEVRAGRDTPAGNGWCMAPPGYGDLAACEEQNRNLIP